MKLFRITKQMPDEWFSQTHRCIMTAETMSDLYSLQTAIDSQLKSKWIGTSTKERLIMLYAYANLRLKLMTKKYVKQNYSYTNK